MVPKPGCDMSSHDAFNSTAIKSPKKRIRELIPNLLNRLRKKSRCCAFSHSVLYVCGPCLVLRNVYAKKLERAGPFYYVAIDSDGGIYYFLTSKVSSLVFAVLRER